MIAGRKRTRAQGLVIRVIESEVAADFYHPITKRLVGTVWDPGVAEEFVIPILKRMGFTVTILKYVDESLK